MTDLLEAGGPIDPARVVALRNAAEELRRRFADLASRAYRHDHVDAAGDARKRQLLEGPIAVLDSLQAVSILAPGPFAQLRSDLVEIRSLFEIDETALKSSVQLPGHSQPRPIDGPSASARLEDCERRADDLLSSWTDTLADSLNEKEMAEQIGYVSDPSARAEIEDAGEDPEPARPHRQRLHRRPQPGLHSGRHPPRLTRRAHRRPVPRYLACHRRAAPRTARWPHRHAHIGRSP